MSLINRNRFMVLRIKRNTWNYLLIVISLVIAITPELIRHFPKPIWMMLIGLWYLDVATKRFFEKSRSRKYIIFLFLWILYILLLRAIGYSSAAIGNYFLIIVSFDIIIKTLYVLENYSEDQKRVLFRIVQVIVLVNLIYNIIIGVGNPNIFYYIFLFPEKYIGMNVAMTQFYEMLAFFIGINVYLLFHENRRSLRIVELISIILSYFFMLSFEPRLTAFVLSIILVILVLFQQNHAIRNKIIVFIVLITIAIFIGLVLRDDIVALLPERMAIRLEAILGYKTSSYTDGQLRRVELQLNSIRTFFSSPITFLIGAGWHLGTEKSSLIGQHALLTDYLAAYGLVGLFFIFYFFKGLRESFLYKYMCEKKYIKICIFVIFVSALLSNPIRPEILPVSVFLPSLLSCVVTQKVRKE